MPSYPSRPVDRIGVTFSDGFWNMNDGRGLRLQPQAPFLLSPSRNLWIRVDGYASQPFGRTALTTTPTGWDTPWDSEPVKDTDALGRFHHPNL